MSAEKNREQVKRFADEQGFSLFGVADISEGKDDFCLDDDLKAKFDRAISLGKRLLDPIIENIKNKPTPLYFHHYRQLNFFLDRGAFLLSSQVQELGFQALPIPASQILDWDKQNSLVSHKHVGVLAGLGWIGRNNLLVNEQLGARFRMVTVLTDMPLVEDQPVSDDCGACKKCLPTCPAQAIKDRQEDFDHTACFEKLREFRKSGLVGQYICGVCVKACSGFKR